MHRLKECIYIFVALIPILAFITVFYAEHTKLKADVEDLMNQRFRVEDKLDKIAEKLNVIDGKISEHMR